MAVVVVGDLANTDVVVEMIRTAFETGPNRDIFSGPTVPVFPHVPHDSPRYQVREVATSMRITKPIHATILT
jgi:hypothetical protein